MARRFVGLAWLALSCAALPTTVFADDPPSKLLEEAATRARLAREALSVTVDNAISKAGKLTADAAGIVLAETIKEVNEANYLTPDERKGFLTKLKAQQKSLDTGATTQADKKPATPKDEADKNDRIRAELKQIEALDKQGKSGDARARLRALLEKNPTNAALLAYATTSSRQDLVKDINRINKNKGDSERGALNDLDSSSGNVPPNGSISYDKERWEKATKRPPAGSVANNLSKREKDILATLDQASKTDFNFNNTSFDQVIKSLERELGFNLVISKQTMEDVRITYESTLTYEIPKNVTKRNLLKSVLSELGLTYIIKGELVQVVSFLQAKSEMRVGILDVGTLMRNGQSAESLINLIKTTVEPDSWDGSGGNGTITVQGNLLVIKNSAEVIYQLGARPSNKR